MPIVKHKSPKVSLLHITPLKVGEIAARVCYDSFNMSEHELIRDKDFFSEKDIEKSEILNKLFWVNFHESVGEHINVSFYIKDLPRNVALEMNRHRICSTSQKSSRYTIDDLINAFISCKYRLDYTKFREVVTKNISITDKKFIDDICDYLWMSLGHLDSQETLLPDLKGSRKKAQNDRVKFILPECWLMDGVWTFNLRSLKNFLKLRSSGSAYYAIQEVANLILEVLPSKYKELIWK